MPKQKYACGIPDGPLPGLLLGLLLYLRSSVLGGLGCVLRNLDRQFGAAVARGLEWGAGIGVGAGSPGLGAGSASPWLTLSPPCKQRMFPVGASQTAGHVALMFGLEQGPSCGRLFGVGVVTKAPCPF